MLPVNASYRNLYKAFNNSALALIISEILAFQICYFLILDQCRAVKHSQLYHSMANINIYKSHSTKFTLALVAFDLLTFRIAYSEI